MRVLLLFLAIKILIFSNFTNAKSEQNKEFKLSPSAVKSFFVYISSDRKTSDRFLVTEDGIGTFTWYCPQKLCFPASEKIYAKPCSKINNNKSCKIFAVGRKVKWKNLGNTKTTSIKFKQSITYIEMKKKLKVHDLIN